MKPFKIRNVEINPPLVLSPMAGVTAVQIFGGQPGRMRMAAEMAEEVGADILDINCGCPAPKVVKHGGGSGLLRDYARLEEILKGIKKAIRIPLTIKIRAGYYDSQRNAVE